MNKILVINISQTIFFARWSPGVNFINNKRTNFSYERRFGSFQYVHVTRKKAAETKFVQKICAFNVDEIDYMPTSNYWLYLFLNFYMSEYV